MVRRVAGTVKLSEYTRHGGRDVSVTMAMSRMGEAVLQNWVGATGP